MRTWTDAPADFSFIYGGTTDAESGKLDFMNTVDFGILPIYSVGRNTYWFYTATGQLVDSDIRLNSYYYSWSTNGSAISFDVETVALHELGHSLCLEDLYNIADSEKVMYGYGSPGLLKRNLHKDDIDGIVFLYGKECIYSISPTSQSFQATGGTGNITITTSNNCDWRAKSNVEWIEITSVKSGSGSGSINYLVSINSSVNPRVGIITVAEKTFTVTQEGKPIISVSTKPINFGTSRAGDELERKVTINNIGGGTLVINSINISGPNASEFDNTICSTIAQGGSCDITIRFKPSIPFGKKTAILSISSNDLKKPIINIKLLAKVSPPKISVTPKTINFGISSTATEKLVMITNKGVSDLVINQIAIKDSFGAPSVDYIIVGNTCDSPIMMGNACSLILAFTPIDPIGNKSALLHILSNDPKKTLFKLKLTGKKDK